MNLREAYKRSCENHCKYLHLHPYRRHSWTPTHFSRQRQCARFTGLNSPRRARCIDGVRSRACGNLPVRSNHICLMGPLRLDEICRWTDLNDIIEFLQATARSVGAEVTSPWFYLQFGLILAAAGIAYAGGRGDSRAGRHDLACDALAGAVAALARVLVGSASTVVFAILVIAARVMMYHSTWPSRSYLLAVSAKLALAWLVIRLVTSVIRNAFIVRLVSLSAWFVAALEHDRPAWSGAGFARTRSRSCSAGLRLTPLLLIKLGALLIVALWLTNIASNFIESRINRSTDLTPSIQVLLVKMIRMGLMIVAVAIALERGRHQPLGACGLLRRGRRRHRFRPAEDRRQFHLGHHPARGQIGEARRPRHHRRQLGPHQRDEDALYLGRRRRRPRIPDPERGSGDAEGRELDLYRQEHAGEGRCSAPITTPIRGWSASWPSRSPPPRRAPSRASRRTAS